MEIEIENKYGLFERENDKKREDFVVCIIFYSLQNIIKNLIFINILMQKKVDSHNEQLFNRIKNDFESRIKKGISSMLTIVKYADLRDLFTTLKQAASKSVSN